MHHQVSSSAAGPPSANYALGVLSEGVGRWLHTSGIGPARPDGTVPADLDEQVEVVWTSLLALVAEAGFSPTDLVSVTTYAVLGNDLGVIMAGRDRALGSHRCASILVPVPALATTTWRLEIAIVAGR